MRQKIKTFVILLVSGILVVVGYQNCGEDSGFRARPYGVGIASIGGDLETTTSTTLGGGGGGGGGGGANFLSQLRVGSSWIMSTQIREGGVTCNGNATHTVMAISGQEPNRTYSMRENYVCGTTYPPRDYTLTEAQMRLPPVSNCAAAMGTVQNIPGPGGGMVETCYRAIVPNPDAPPDNLYLWRADVPVGYVRLIFEDNDGYRETLNLTSITF